MNPAPLLFALCCLGFVFAALLAFEVALFRVSCALCRVPQANVLKSTGVVLVMLVIPAVVDAGVAAGLTEAYRAGGYPLWEAGMVGFFLALPAHMVICATVHAKMMGLFVGQGLAVWLVEKLLKLCLVAALAAVVAVVVAASSS